ncbi:hypothetical protein BPOR_1179g00030 [Botrytis porri]|uniref:Uncharacterized protein n=1 Tax=Botrytis porri TaxID=87229 RepID=A0A4Z1KJM5_9HELO|nr:hypothetical protein BPOR_1179g00030 [Botrytis porri]
MVHACAPVRLLGSGFGGTDPASPAESLKQPIETNPNVAVLVTEGVVGVVIDIDGSLFDGKGAMEEVEGVLDRVSIVDEVVVEEVSETSALEDNDEDIEETITPLRTGKEIELVEEMELKLEIAPVPL